MSDPVGTISTIVIGLYAGSLLTEGAVMVPFWRKMPPADFNRLHKEVGPSLFRYFAPLTTVAVALAVISAAMAADGKMERFIAAGLCLLALAVFFLYFRSANNKFASQALSEEDLAAELKRWHWWHHFRTVAIVGAFIASAFA